MSDPAALSSTPPTTAAAVQPPPPPPPTTTRRRRMRKRFWLLLLLALAACLALSTPPWHALLRKWLVWQAAREGCDLSIDAIEGGPFDTFHLYGLRFRQHGAPPANTDDPAFPLARGTNLFIDRAEITLAWSLPSWRQRPEPPSWVSQFTVEGVRGRLDLSANGSKHPAPTLPGRLGWTDALAARLIPSAFLLRAEDFTLRRGRYHLRAQNTFLTGSYAGEGLFLAQSLEVGGPTFDTTLADRHGQTFWQGTSLTLADLDLGHGLQLARATLNGSHLARRRLDWDCDLRALGGTIRGEGAINFSGSRLALELGGTVQQITLGPMGRLLEITGPANGRVQQASFSFRGDPENWPAAEMWLAGRATDFRWGERRWQSLEMQAVVTNRRVQVHRLELQQSRNRLSLSGECSLPPDNAARGQAGRWWQAGFACNVDARLEDLHDLAQLIGPQMPDLAGRMSVNGRLSARPGTQGYDGYLNVEGSRLGIRGAPLDYLKSTLIFRGEELDVADLQATRGGDYLAGKGSLRIAGPTDFQALGRVSIADLGVYAPAWAGLLPWASDASAAPIRALTAGVRLDGSVLHLDQCQGERDGGTFQMTGSVDLRDTVKPVLDLALTGQQPPRMADPADNGALWRAGVAYTLDLRGPLADNGVAVHGDVQLVHGHFDGTWQLDANRPPALRSPVGGRWFAASAHHEMFLPGPPWPLAASLMQPLLRRLPAAWRDWPLDLRVTAADPLPSGSEHQAVLNVVKNDFTALLDLPPDIAGHEGGVTPDLRITGTGNRPLLGGSLAFRSADVPGWGQAGGAWYFSPGQPENPTVSITATDGSGQRGTFFYGPLSQGQAISWHAAPPAGVELTLQPTDTAGERYGLDDGREPVALTLPPSEMPMRMAEEPEILSEGNFALPIEQQSLLNVY